MDGTKPWWQSKTIIGSIVTGILSIYMTLIQQGVHLPSIPAWIITVLAGIGIYTRSTATDKIG